MASEALVAGKSWVLIKSITKKYELSLDLN